ncbi:6-pyruvoyl trahydropterin synthase family protein [Rhodovibrio salinarum]|uniref:6-carboxy-5,6,7,8-tetrahydropterin synthase n=1 Tax=Rhodovibrio salinarum TaxID=1087 RepID=A0A934QIB6_9PROT|nr:6-carboxytetrahydropterin synthase [Rhodovibrio salinarum]MBK1697568.1 6-carboxytetrahydropterin synthase [Rhodovibrio salinarum]
MFSVTVRDRFMIAHSFRGETFGPARNLHGATYVVDCEFRCPTLDRDGLAVDIAAASDLLNEVVGGLHMRNLDEASEFEGQNTTTEFLAKTIYDRLASRIEHGALGPEQGGLVALKVTLGESDIAWASYEGPLPATLG